MHDPVKLTLLELLWIDHLIVTKHEGVVFAEVDISVHEDFEVERLLAVVHRIKFYRMPERQLLVVDVDCVVRIRRVLEQDALATHESLDSVKSLHATLVLGLFHEA